MVVLEREMYIRTLCLLMKNIQSSAACVRFENESDGTNDVFEEGNAL